jgi:hypothetical protein
MTDYAQVDMLIRLSEVPEIDPVQDKVLLYSASNRTAGYAREDDHIILTAMDVWFIDFDAFLLASWIDVAFRNEGPNSVVVTLFDGANPFDQLLESGRSILLRHFKDAQAAPVLTSTLGTKVRMFAWGEPHSAPQ